MTEGLEKYIVKFDSHAFEKILENWKWLIGDNFTLILISCIGDLFLEDTNKIIYWLNTGEGEIKIIANNLKEFNKKITDKTFKNELFLCDLVEQIFESGISLSENQILSYKKLPIIGGEYIVENFIQLSIEEHFGLTGEIHRKLSKLPDGTNVEIKLI